MDKVWGPWQASKRLLKLVGDLTDRSPQVERILDQFRSNPPGADPATWDDATSDRVTTLADCFAVPPGFFSEPTINGVRGIELDLNIRARALQREIARREIRYRMCRGSRPTLDVSTPEGYREGLRLYISEMEFILRLAEDDRISQWTRDPAAPTST